MIRFACPGCRSAYEVDDGRAGQTGQCGKCGDKFVIPGGKRPAAAEPVEVEPCPKCGNRLAVLPDDLGMRVVCPACGEGFVAVRPTDAPSLPPVFGDDEYAVPIHRPDEVRTAGTLFIVGGVIAIVVAGVLALLSVGYCLMWPGLYLALVWAIAAMVRGRRLYSDRLDPGRNPPWWLAAGQIALIINGDVVNVALGVFALIALNHPNVLAYYAARRETRWADDPDDLN